MKRARKRLSWMLLVLALGLGAGLFALQRWVASEEFRIELQARAQRALAVPVVLGRVQADLWPFPTLALEGVELGTHPAMTAQRIDLRLELGALLAGRLGVASLVLQGADLPQLGIDQLLAAQRRRQPEPTGHASADPVQAPAQPLALLPRRIVLDGLTWRSSRDEATTLDATATLDRAGLPDAITLRVRAGAFQGAQAQATRTGADAPGARDAPMAWDLLVQHAGGSITGVLQLQRPAGEAAVVSLQARLETRNLQLGALRRGAPGPLGGRLRASTTLSAKAEGVAGLAQALVTQSTFTVDDAVINGLDLAKAVQTVGLSRGGLTRLDTLSGQLTTRGATLRLHQLVARSGALGVTGDITVAPNRRLSGRIHVHLGEKMVGRAVGVPLEIGGTLEVPSVTLTRAAMLGATMGTLVLPGLGTAAGATVGDAVGEKLESLFGK